MLGFLGVSIQNKKEKIGLGLGAALFTVTQRKVLGLLFSSPEKRYYGKEIISLSAAGSGAVQRELEKLVAVGLVLSFKEGKQRYYSANRQSIIFNELQAIVIETFGLFGGMDLDQRTAILYFSARRIPLTSALVVAVAPPCPTLFFDHLNRRRTVV